MKKGFKAPVWEVPKGEPGKKTMERLRAKTDPNSEQYNPEGVTAHQTVSFVVERLDELKSWKDAKSRAGSNKAGYVGPVKRAVWAAIEELLKRTAPVSDRAVVELLTRGSIDSDDWLEDLVQCSDAASRLSVWVTEHDDHKVWFGSHDGSETGVKMTTIKKYIREHRKRLEMDA